MTEPVWKMPSPSQEFDQGPRLRQDPGDQLAIAYDFEGEDGTYAWEEILFTGVVAFRFTSARHSSVEQVEAYDQLVRVSGSSWVDGVGDPPPGLAHYRIFFDDIGAYEVLATGFVPPPEHRV